MKRRGENHASAIALGLTDALVEITGSLAGLSLALFSSKLIAMSGLVIGFAAALSMTASEYLSAKEDERKKDKAVQLATYTGITYIAAVILLVLPYFFIQSVHLALFAMGLVSVGLILAYSFYIKRVKKESFTKTFLEMFIISFVVALLSFFIAYILKKSFGIEA